MIDSDIKAEFDDVMTSNQLGFSNVDSLDLLNNLDDLETPFKFDSRYHGVDEVLNHPPQWNQQQSVGQDVSAINSTYFDDSLSNSHNVMVNIWTFGGNICFYRAGTLDSDSQSRAGSGDC